MVGYPEGSDLTLMNTIYIKPKKKEDGKYTAPIMNILFKDNVTGIKHIKEIKNPTYKFYVANDNVYLDNPEFFISEDKVHPVEVPYSDLEKEIAKIIGMEDVYFDNIKCGNRYANKEFHTDKRIFHSDTDIQDHYRSRFDELYTNNINPITKSYLDIEVDLCEVHHNSITGKTELRRAIAGDFPEPGEVPINAVTYVSEQTKQVFTFLLRNKDNPLIQKFEDNIGPEMFERLRNLLKYTVGGNMKMKKYKLDQYEFKMIFYDQDKEIDLIADIFKMVNTFQPDFLLVWNMAFDIPYIIERIKKLGYDPRDIMCSPDVKYKECEYFVDTANANEFAQRGDYANITCRTVYLDQMIQFASRRKGQSAFTSFSLNSIGGVVAKVHKLDYSHITSDIGQLPYLDYETFVFYNIIDTIVQKCIEDKTQDVNYIFSKCILNDTRYQKGHRQTVYLTNRAGKFFKSLGFIIGNNQNRNNVPVQYGGGLVGDPVLINNYARMIINSIPINCYENLDDFDFKSLYPSLAREFNLAPNTQIGKLDMPEKIWDGENLHEDDPSFSLNREGLFMENLQSHNYLLICHRWFGLADFETLITEDLKEFFTTKAIPSQRVWDQIMNDGYKHPMMIINDSMYSHPMSVYPVYDRPIQDVSEYKDKVMNNYSIKGVS